MAAMADRVCPRDIVAAVWNDEQYMYESIAITLALHEIQSAKFIIELKGDPVFIFR